MIAILLAIARRVRGRETVAVEITVEEVSHNPELQFEFSVSRTSLCFRR
jgi:hypothetical protein